MDTNEQTETLRLWSIPAWRYAFPAAVISRLGDYVFDITVVLWITTVIAKGQSWAPAAVSGVLIAAALPVLLVGPVAGVFADRFDRHRLLVVSNAVQAMSIGSLLLIPTLGNGLSAAVKLVWIYGAIVVTNAAGQFFNQARIAMISKTIPDQLRTSAFSVQGSANSAIAIIGPPLAAPLLISAGVQWALAINALSFILSSLLLNIVRWGSVPETAAAEQSFWESLRDGARAIAANRILLAITIAVTVLTFASGAVTVLEVFFVTDVLHEAAALVGLFAMAYAAGTLLGMASAPWIERRVEAARIFVGGVVLVGLFLVVFSRTTSVGVAMAFLFVSAVPLGVINTVLMPLAMRSVPAEMLGRSMAVLNIFPTIASLMAMALTGWAVSTVLQGWDAEIAGLHFGPVDSVFTFAGLLMLATGLAVWRPIIAARNLQPTPDKVA